MYQGFSSFWKGTSALTCAAAAAHRGLVRDHEAVSSNLATRTMQSVLIGSEYPVMDTLLFYFSQNSYCNLFRGVAECYAFSCFHDNVGLRDFPAIWHIESTDAVVVDHDTLIGKAADQRDGECQSEGGDSLQSIRQYAWAATQYRLQLGRTQCVFQNKL